MDDKVAPINHLSCSQSLATRVCRSLWAACLLGAVLSGCAILFAETATAQLQEPPDQQTPSWRPKPKPRPIPETNSIVLLGTGLLGLGGALLAQRQRKTSVPG